MRNVVDIGNGRPSWARDGNPYVIFISDKDLHHHHSRSGSELVYFMVRSSRISRLTVLRACMLYRRRLPRENKFHEGISVSPFPVQRTVEQDTRRETRKFHADSYIRSIFRYQKMENCFSPERKLLARIPENWRRRDRTPSFIVIVQTYVSVFLFSRCFTTSSARHGKNSRALKSDPLYHL